jgi:hypothetical protein
MIASRVCLNMQACLAQLRLARAFREDADRFAEPMVRLAQLTLLYGREYGLREAGRIDTIELPDAGALEKEIAKDMNLQSQVDSVTDAAKQTVREVAVGGVPTILPAFVEGRTADGCYVLRVIRRESGRGGPRCAARRSGR